MMKTTLFLFTLLLLLGGGSQSLSAESDSLLFLNRILNENTGNVDDNMRRLSSGRYLLTDDPANEAIYQKLETHIRSLDKQVGNTADMQFYYQYTESLLGDIIQILQRIRELLISRSNTVYTADQGSLVDAEIDIQYDGIIFLLEHADFNGRRVFAPIFKDPEFLKRFREEAYYRLENIDRLLTFFITQRSVYGAKMNQLRLQQKALMKESENASGMQSTLMDVDFGNEMMLLKKNQLLVLSNLLLLGREVSP
ncbi:MAG TPA: hypothetical protein ENN69_07600 [Spirochaetia bacterium]|nr:hypothetical protein [Spirochaetia bacterium]